jgi:glutathione synthase
MKIGFVVNEVETEKTTYTTTLLAMEAVNLGHESWVIGLGDLAYDLDDHIRARAVTVPRKNYKSPKIFLDDLKGESAVRKRITIEDLDVLMLRNVPSDDTLTRPWAANIAVEYGRIALKHGVLVVNDPNGLSMASSKMYFQLFPEEVRPKTLITRDRDEIKTFANEEGAVVLKPLQGSGGANVFLVRKQDFPNINQMIDAVSRDGYVVAQEYLPAAHKGDIRLFMMNGRPLRVKGRYAAFRRLRSEEDLRSNVHAGGKIESADINDTVLRIAEIVRPKLVQDGIFLAGLDIAGDKLMEINVFSPGGLGHARKFTKINFARYVIGALERKVQYVEYYGRNFDNVDMCTL